MTKKRRVLAVLTGALLLVAGGAVGLLLVNRRDVTTSSREAYEAYKQALIDEHRFYFKEARLGYARALELDPDFAMAMLGLAGRSSESEQRAALVRRAARQKERLTERERFHVDIALAELEKNREAVLKLGHELHARYPGDSRGVMILVGEQLAKGNRDQAIQIFEDLLALDPNNAEAYNQIGYYYGFRGEYEKAIENLTKYRFIARDNANPFDSLGENQAYWGRYNEAIENLNAALAIKADFAPAYQHLGVAYEGMGEYAKAMRSYEKAAELDDSADMRREYLFMALRAGFYLGDMDAVRRTLDSVEKLPVDPKSEHAAVQPLYLAAVRAVAGGNPKEAEARLNELRRALEARFEAYSKAGRLAPNRKPHFPEWNFLMAHVLEAEGRVDEALKLYELNANPPNPFNGYDERRWIMEARAKVAEILARKGDLDQAEKLIAENRKWNPSWAPCRPSETVVAELRRQKVLAASK